LATEVKLTKIKEASVILNLLNSSKDTQDDVFVWKLIAGEEYLGQVRIESVSKSRKDFCIIPMSNHERSVQNLLINQSHIDFFIPNSSLLLRCQLKKSEAPERYYLHFPKIVAQVDRRSGLRTSALETNDVVISFSSKAERGQVQQFSKSCFDISSGGFSFYVSKLEKKFFNPGEMLDDLRIKTHHWDIKVEAQLILTKEIEPDEYNGLGYKAWRINCRFKNLDQVSRRHLDRFILERIKDDLHVINA
jgi:hypothetical protein